MKVSPFNKNTKIIFGDGKRKLINSIIKSKKRILLICSKRGKKEIYNDKNFSFLNKNNIYLLDRITPNPTIIQIKKIIKKIKNKKFDFIIGIGGGSTIDTAKALKLFLSIKKNYSMNFVIKNINSLEKKLNCKLIALPTTSGTGSEVTCYSTVWDSVKKKKLSLNNSFLYPDYAIVDPQLTYGLNINQTIYTGLDALNQAFESVWNKNSNMITRKYAAKSIRNNISALIKINKDINNKNSRSVISKSSLLAGICISKTRTCICHSISYPLTAHYGVPHGLACAFTMLEVIKYILNKDKHYFRKLFKNSKYQSEKLFLKEIKELFKVLKIKKRIKSFKVSYKKILPLINEMYTPERADNFPFEINQKFIKNIIKKSLK